MKKYKWKFLHHCKGEDIYWHHRYWIGAAFSWLYQLVFNHERGIILKENEHYYD